MKVISTKLDITAWVNLKKQDNLYMKENFKTTNLWEIRDFARKNTRQKKQKFFVRFQNLTKIFRLISKSNEHFSFD